MNKKGADILVKFNDYEYSYQIKTSANMLGYNFNYTTRGFSNEIIYEMRSGDFSSYPTVIDSHLEKEDATHFLLIHYKSVNDVGYYELSKDEFKEAIKIDYKRYIGSIKQEKIKTHNFAISNDYMRSILKPENVDHYLSNFKVVP